MSTNLPEKSDEDIQRQQMDEAIERIKEAATGMNESLEELKGFFHNVEANDGKIPDVNGILQQVLSKNKDDRRH